MNIEIKQLNPSHCLTYLVKSRDSKEIILIDPVLEHVDYYLEILKNENLKLTHVIDTHTHADHISGAASLVDKTLCIYVIHKSSPVKCAHLKIDEHFEEHIAGMSVKIIHTPGHTEDSICLIIENNIFTGDTLFLDDGGAGRDDLPGGNSGKHWESLQNLLILPDNLIVYPSHEYRGRKPSSLKEQKLTNPFLKLKSKEEFIQYLEELKLGPAEWMKHVLKANYACARDPKAVWIPVDSPACEVKGTLDIGVNEQSVEGLSASELISKLNTNISNFILLDVRDESELKSDLGKIEGAINIPVVKLSGKLNELEKYKNNEIITICKKGGRAITAAQILKQAGFKNVFYLNGGMSAYRENLKEELSSKL